MSSFRNMLAAGGLALALSVVPPATAQNMPPNGMHDDSHGGGPGMHSGDMQRDHQEALSGRGPNMGDRHPDMRGEHGGWRRSHHRHCRTVWRHHHRVRRCA